MAKQEAGFKWSELLPFIKSRIFLYTLIRFALLMIILWLLNSFFINIYTNHGQKLIMPKFVGMPFQKASKLANAKGYEILASDSIHVVGRPGGVILSQVPSADAQVKRGRKIYVTVTRFNPDLIQSNNLPDLYGKKFEFKKTELENVFGLRTKVVGFKFDPGPVSHIMEVTYHGKILVDQNKNENGVSIPKGDTLYFILSTDSGGELNIPDLRCKTLAEVKFLLSASKLNIGKIEHKGNVTSEEDAFVISQSPEFDINKKIKMGESLDLVISDELPSDCQNQ